MRPFGLPVERRKVVAAFRKKFSALLVVLTISGCGSLIRVQELDLDWQPSHISMEKCPNLSGWYQYEMVIRTHPIKHMSDNLIGAFAGNQDLLYKNDKINPSTGLPKAGGNFPDYQTRIEYGPKLDTSSILNEQAAPGKYYSMFHLNQSSNLLTQKIEGGSNLTVTKLGTKMAGCANGAVIFRYFSRWGGADFVSQGMSYGEFEMRKLPDGSLEVTRRMRSRERSAGLGILGPVKMRPTVIRVYPPAK